MPHLRFSIRQTATLVFAGTLLTAGCEGNRSSTRRDTSKAGAPDPSLDNATTGGSGTPWIQGIGPAFLVEGSAAEEAIVIGPHSGDTMVAALQAASAQAAAVILLGRGGAQITGHLGAGPGREDAGCLTWPLQDLRTDGTPGTWSLGFIGATARVIALDSVDVLTSRDSMALVAEVSRLASSVTTPSGPAFQGLRFTAHDVRRFEASPGVLALAAHAIRRVNQEANPQEEHTLLIAERDSGVVSGPYRLVYAERTSALEDQVTTPEVVAAATVGGRLWVVIARDNDTGVSYSVLERVSKARWTVLWTSRPLTCS